MATEIILTDPTYPKDGIILRYKKSTKTIEVDGFYDNNNPIYGGIWTVEEFCDMLGIDKRDIPSVTDDIN